MNDSLLYVKGVNGQLTLFEDKVVISRKGLGAFLSFPFSKDRVLPISQITKVHVKEPGSLTNGFIQFLTHLDLNELSLLTAGKNKNCVFFNKNQSQDILKVKQTIDDQLFVNSEANYQAAPTASPKVISHTNAQNEQTIQCPKCGSTQVTGMKKGFSVGKAVAGTLLVGGVLMGFVGSNKVMVGCLNCGHKWQAGKK